MSSKDISRYLFQPEKHYASVRMQQGRVMLDSDWNESERIDDEEARRILAETICTNGTPNEGFLVEVVTAATVTGPPVPGEEFPPAKETYDFALDSGSFYLGGLRFEVVTEIVANGPDITERFLSQTDWLQIDADLGNLPARPSVADLTNSDGSFKFRHDLVYLRGWEQCVSAVEDGELRERALGGPDTSVRIRRMRRIEVLPDVELDLTGGNFCAEAFARLKENLTAPREGDDTGEPHRFDEANAELISKAKLTVRFREGGITEDLCKPAVIGGFLGAENQTIRVQLTATNRFIWGYDNASPLYRVQVLEEAGQPVKIKFLTLPRDQASQPLNGQAIEILPWSAFLPNQEKVAELQGHIATVATSFNPEEQTITLSKPVPQAWIDWLNDPAHAKYLSGRDPVDKQKYFYLRLWTGGSGDADQADHAFTPGLPIELLGTGLSVSFSQHGLPGDLWIVAARPNTPDLVVPWELMEQAPPAGTRSFFSPLALILWFVDVELPTTVKSQVLDCRHKFRPLCEVGEGLRVSNGRVIFENVNPGAGEKFPRVSPPIGHGLNINNVAFILGLDVNPDPNRAVVMGDLDAFNIISDLAGPIRFFPVLIAAAYDSNDPNRQFTITLKDLRDEGEPQTWVVHWWAIPKTLDQPDVIVPPPSQGGGGADIDVTPNPLNFGIVTVGQMKELDLTVTNNGSTTLNVISISSDNERFSTVPPNVSFAVAASGQEDVKVRFAPTLAVAQTGKLSINIDPDERTLTVQVQGVGNEPIPDIVVPSILDFGVLEFGPQPKVANLEVRNTGNTLLTVTSVTIEGPDSVNFRVISPTPFTVAANGLVQVTMQFRRVGGIPLEPQAKNGTAVITSDDPDPDEKVSRVPLQGVINPP